MGFADNYGTGNRLGVVKITNLEQLYKEVGNAINKFGYDADLNYMDISELDDLGSVFYMYREFNGDISKWDTSNVVCMHGLFQNSLFNGDISEWEMSSVKDTSYMFSGSKFNGDISMWDLTSVIDMSSMFTESEFDGSNCTGDLILPKNIHSFIEGLSYMYEDTLYNTIEGDGRKNRMEIFFNEKLINNIKNIDCIAMGCKNYTSIEFK